MPPTPPARKSYIHTPGVFNAALVPATYICVTPGVALISTAGLNSKLSRSRGDFVHATAPLLVHVGVQFAIATGAHCVPTVHYPFQHLQKFRSVCFRSPDIYPPSPNDTIQPRHEQQIQKDSPALIEPQPHCCYLYYDSDTDTAVTNNDTYTQ